jgi:hypothetical protein
MNTANTQKRSERFGEICQAIGFTLWQLQTLEGSTAQFFVLVEQAIPQMGEEEGNLLVVNAQKKTFGGSISRLSKSEHLPQDVLVRFQALLKDRNWLVHSSNTDSKKALDDDAAYVGLHRRLESIASEAGRLLKEISALSEKFVLRHGVSIESLEAKIAQTLQEWES